MHALDIVDRVATYEPTGRAAWAARVLFDKRKADDLLPHLTALVGKPGTEVSARARELELTPQERSAFSILVPHAQRLEADLAGPREVQAGEGREGRRLPQDRGPAKESPDRD
jgi:hypothetical protein